MKSNSLTPRERAERALRHVSLFPQTETHKEAVMTMVEVEIEAAIKAEREANSELESKLFSLLEEYQGLIAHLLETQQTVGPMGKKAYQVAMEQINRINLRLAEWKAGLGIK